MSHAAALIALHVAVALFGFAGTLRQVARAVAGGHRPRAHGHRGHGARHPAPAHRRARPVRRAPDRERRRAGLALALLLRGDPGLDRGRRSAGLRELSAVHARGRARVPRASPAPARRGDGACSSRRGSSCSCPSSRSRIPIVQGLGWGLVSGFTFALLVVMNRRWTASRPATDIAFWQNLLAALALLPFVWAAPLGNRGDRRARDRAAHRAGPRVHGARAHAVHRRRSPSSTRTRRA